LCKEAEFEELVWCQAPEQAGFCLGNKHYLFYPGSGKIELVGEQKCLASIVQPGAYKVGQIQTVQGSLVVTKAMHIRYGHGERGFPSATCKHLCLS
jgi:hypothetical protein